MRGRAPSARELAEVREAAETALVAKHAGDAFGLDEGMCAETERSFRDLATPEMVLRLIGTIEGRLR